MRRRHGTITVIIIMLVVTGAPALVGGPPPAFASSRLNTQTTLVLHAVPQSLANLCFTPEEQGFDCSGEGRPQVEVGAQAAVDIYLYAHNYEELAGVQCAFDWPADWQYLAWGPFAGGGCQSLQTNALLPTAAGATDGTLATVFDCILDGFLASLGFLSFTAGDSGCLSIIESAFPFGTHVVGCGGEVTPVEAAGRGRVCVGPGGVDACDPPQPVEAATWGAIKAGYAR